MKKLLLLILLLIFLFSCTIAPLSDSGSPTDAGDAFVSTTSPEIKPDIPARNMGGREFKILTTGWWTHFPLDVIDVAPGELNGEVVNDAAYERKVRVEDQYNCKIIQIDEADPAASVTKLQNSVMANDADYDVALIRGTNFANLITNGSLLDLDDMPYVDFEKPWWNKNAYDALALGGKHFGIVGNISTNEMLATWICCFNKSIIVDFHLDNPYELVKDGIWTINRAASMAKEVSNDINGDGKMDADDSWGINYTSDTVMGMLNGCGVNIAQLDSAGVPQITIESEANITKIQRINDVLLNDTYSVDTLRKFAMAGKDGYIFGDNRCLFLFAATHIVGELRQMDVEFGLIPYPKYDSDQKDYLSTTSGIFLPILCIPVTIQDIENTGIFLEAFSYEGNKTVLPAFYENVLKGKMIRDVESIDMLDYIYSNITYDTGNLFNFGGFVGTLTSELSQGQASSIASFLASRLTVVQSAIDKMIDEIN